MGQSPLQPLLQILIALLVLAAPVDAFAESSGTPDWLRAHVGTGEGQIAPVVLERARALHQEKTHTGETRNPCYFAMDATRPSVARNGQPGRRFFVICEQQKTFRAVSSGYGNGRKLEQANFANGRQCAKNFSNAEGSKLSTGGAYLTAESRTSFKGYFSKAGETTPFYRTFLLFDGQGETSNARERAIGGHRAMFLRWQCRLKKPSSPHADADGYVPFGRLVDYTSGRSNGCTTWSAAATPEILAMVDGKPTTLYIYPESRDINAVAQAVRNRTSLAGTGIYWDPTCLREIGVPKFWPKSELQPIINAWRDSLPEVPPRVLPICK